LFAFRNETEAIVEEFAAQRFLFLMARGNIDILKVISTTLGDVESNFHELISLKMEIIFGKCHFRATELHVFLAYFAII
jgi:hypothetical protein